MAAAKADPTWLHVGIDANAAGMADVSARAARPARRGGVPNALFVAGALEALPGPLAGAAGAVTILLPWGSLLGAVAGGESAALAGIHAICRPGAPVEAMFSFDPTRDASELVRLGIDPESGGALCANWTAAGFAGATLEPLPPSALATLGTTWARRLARNPARRVYRLRAHAGSSLPSGSDFAPPRR